MLPVVATEGELSASPRAVTDAFSFAVSPSSRESLRLRLLTRTQSIKSGESPASSPANADDCGRSKVAGASEHALVSSTDVAAALELQVGGGVGRSLHLVFVSFSCCIVSSPKRCVCSALTRWGRCAALAGGRGSGDCRRIQPRCCGRPHPGCCLQRDRRCGCYVGGGGHRGGVPRRRRWPLLRQCAAAAMDHHRG